MHPIRNAVEVGGILRRSGLLDPSYGISMARATRRWGAGLAAGFTAAAQRRPAADAIVDESGRQSFAELDARSTALALGLEAQGARAGGAVGILCRNHRSFVEAACAAAKLGAHQVFLNTGFAGPQLGEVLEREEVLCVIYDEEFVPLVEKHGGSCPRIVAGEGFSIAGAPTLESLIEAHRSVKAPPTPAKPGRATILTSGTTGTPKGAQRDSKTASITTLAGLLERMPLRTHSVHVLAAPAFHAWGLSHVLIGGSLGATLVMRRRFDPEATLADIERNRADVLVVVPVMLQRILALDPSVRERYDTSSLRMVVASGSALPGELALRWMDAFGDNLYNFYGSTEVAHASIAMPEDLRAAPGTAGRVPRGVVVEILDDEDRALPPGRTGRIFVGNDSQFEGYTGGGGKNVVHGLMSVGDMGHFDEAGRLFVEGRDDDMIISGGENVFPSEVENLLADHPEIADVAVIGVPDPDFGQALRAFVVPRPGAQLDSESVRSCVKASLANYKVPRSVVFLDELPRNPTGKVLKRELREHA